MKQYHFVVKFLVLDYYRDDYVILKINFYE